MVFNSNRKCRLTKVFLYTVTYMVIALIALYIYLRIQDVSKENLIIRRKNEFKADDFISKGLTVKHKKSNKSSPAKILLWSSYFGDKWSFPAQIRTAYESKCVVTTNKSEHDSAEAVVLHLADITLSVPNLIFHRKFPEPLPMSRHRDQVWVLHNLEPNSNFIGNLRVLNDRFNATWSFIKESDIYHPYGNVRDIAKGTTPLDDIDYYEVNSKAGAAAMISNCYDSSRRLEIIHELRDYLHIRVLGHCGENCPGNFGSCNREVLNYKFYLAIENSQCRDYVTEKYWRALKNNQVPIVAWAYSMDSVVIPNSYINIYDFPSLYTAGRYIQEVGQNKSLYNSYFRWKRHFEIYTRNPWHDLCDFLHFPNRSYTTYHDMEGWLTGNTCEQTTIARFIKTILRRHLSDIGL